MKKIISSIMLMVVAIFAIGCAHTSLEYSATLEERVVTLEEDVERLSNLIDEQDTSFLEMRVEKLETPNTFPPQPEGCVTIDVDYTITPTTIATEYDWVNSHIDSSDFHMTPRAKGKVTREICWFVFAEPKSSEGAKWRIEFGDHFLVADIWELNALGTAKSNLQQEFPLFGLGSQWRPSGGHLYVPVLDSRGDRRHLDLDLYNDISISLCRYVAIRNIRK